MSARFTFLAIRFCTSVLLNTPQREAMGYIRSAFKASSFICSTEKPNSSAIWSIKAPVPPAQFPFMRKSVAVPLRKNTTLASSPPMSIIVVQASEYCFTYCVAATTSCTKGNPHFSAIPIPTDPVSRTQTSASPVFCCISDNKADRLSFILAW